METLLEAIARQNFRTSGYITHPGSERRVPWSFTSMPRSPLTQTDAVNTIQARRAQAVEGQKSKPRKLRTLFNALFPR